MRIDEINSSFKYKIDGDNTAAVYNFPNNFDSGVDNIQPDDLISLQRQVQSTLIHRNFPCNSISINEVLFDTREYIRSVEDEDDNEDSTFNTFEEAFSASSTSHYMDYGFTFTVDMSNKIDESIAENLCDIISQCIWGQYGSENEFNIAINLIP